MWSDKELLQWALNCVCKTQITPYHPVTTAEGGKKWLCCSALNWYVNIYVVTRINCHSTRKGGRLRKGCQDQTSKLFVGTSGSICSSSSEWAYLLSYLRTCGFQVSSAFRIRLLHTWISVYTPARRVLLVWSQPLMLEKPRPGWPGLHVHMKSRVEGWFHSLINHLLTDVSKM